MSRPRPDPRFGLEANLVAPEAPLVEAIGRLDAARQKLIVLVDPEGRLVGTVSDGDVRRGLLRGVRLEDQVRAVANLAPLTIPAKGEAAAVTRRRLEERGVAMAPVVDAAGRVVGLFPDAPATPAERDNLVVIMAGGRGVRLAPLTHTCPKPMLKVGGRPLLETILERLRARGFRRFRLAVNYLAEIITDHFGDGSAFGVEIDYLREEAPLGTAGALSLLKEPLDAPLLVMNGDLLTRVDFGGLLDFHRDHGGDATLCVRRERMQAAFGVVETDGDRFMTGLVEKPTYEWLVNCGIYALSPRALDILPPGERFDMTDALKRLADDGRGVGVFPLHEDWLDVGRPDDLETARREAG
ncbi:MAG: nucleotidyltransferase family protein [Brevundimonas sp.]|uniref:nucleotidyltransferase family protein n=1 Tax=Brevundimonas sp. TaxID=1871086 RepID=UPI0039189C8E